MTSDSWNPPTVLKYYRLGEHDTVYDLAGTRILDKAEPKPEISCQFFVGSLIVSPHA
jgi:hypothetical protein